MTMTLEQKFQNLSRANLLIEATIASINIRQDDEAMRRLAKVNFEVPTLAMLRQNIAQAKELLDTAQGEVQLYGGWKLVRDKYNAFQARYDINDTAPGCTESCCRQG